MKRQLNEQKEEKEVKKKEVVQESKAYHNVLMAHLDLVD
jgi:hemerythrin-like domain-containing protein